MDERIDLINSMHAARRLAAVLPTRVLHEKILNMGLNPLLTYEYADAYQRWAVKSEGAWQERQHVSNRCTYCARRNPASAYVCEGCGAPLE